MLIECLELVYKHIFKLYHVFFGIKYVIQQFFNLLREEDILPIIDFCRKKRFTFKIFIRA